MRESVRDYSSQPVRNLLTNPSAEALGSGGNITVYQNLLTNPSAEGVTTGSALLRTNLVPNPSSEGGTPAFPTAGTGTATATLDATRFFSGTQSTRITVPGGINSAGFKTQVITVQPSTTYAISFYVYLVSGQFTGLPFISGSDYATNLTTMTGSAVTGSWVRYTSIYTTNSYQTNLMAWAISTAAGVYNLDALLIEQTDQILPYFDGSTPSAQGWTYAWSGVANNSTSTAKAANTVVSQNLVINPSGETVVGGTSFVRTNLCLNPNFETDYSTTWYYYGSGVSIATDTTQKHSGTQSLKVNANATTPGISGALSSRQAVPVTPGGTYTFSAWVYSTLRGVVPRVEWYTNTGTTASPNVYLKGVNGTTFNPSSGWQRISLTTTAPDNAQAAIFGAYAVFTTTTDYFNIDDVLFEQTDQVRPYFDGTTAAAQGWAYAWTGTAGASSSTAKASSVPVWQNMANNPSAESVVAGTITLRTNLHPNPGLNNTVSTSGYAFYAPSGFTNAAGTGRAVGTFGPAAAYYRTQFATVAPAISLWAVSSGAGMAGIPVTAGFTYTASLYGRVSWAGAYTTALIEWYKADGTYIGSISSPTVANGTNTVERRSTTSVAPAGAAYARVSLYRPGNQGTDPAVNDYIDISGVLWEQTDQLRPYFDGATAAALGWAYGWSGTVGASTSTAKATSVAVWTNGFSNPSFAAVASGTTYTRTNLAPDPRCSSGAPMWSWNGGNGSAATNAVISGVSGMMFPTVYRITWTVASTGSAGAIGMLNTAIPVTAGTTYSASVDARVSVSQGINVEFKFFDAQGGSVVQSGPVTNASPNTVYRLQNTKVAPAGAVSAQVSVVSISTGGTAWPVGSYMEATGFLVEQTDQQRPYFDGATTSALGWTYAWSGVANNSISTAKAAATTVRTNLCTNPSFETTGGWTGYGNAVPWSLSTAQAYIGTQSAYITPTPTNTGFLGVSSSSIPVSGSTQYTFSGYAFKTTTTGTIGLGVDWYDSTGTRINGTSTQSAFTNTLANTWQRGTYTVTSPANAASVLINLFIATYTGGVDAVYFDAVLFEASTVVGTYFSGATPSLGDFNNTWTGTANASTSTQLAPRTTEDNGLLPQSTIYSSFARAYTGSSSVAVKVNTAIAASSSLFYPQADPITLTGVLYTYYAYVYVPTGTPAVRLEDAATNTVGTANTVFDAWQRISVTFTSSGANSSPRLRSAATTVPGTTFWVGAKGFVMGTYTGAHFSGDTASTGDLLPAWTGTPNASVSELRAPKPYNFASTASDSPPYTGFNADGTLNVSSISSQGTGGWSVTQTALSGITAGAVYTVIASIKAPAGRSVIAGLNDTNGATTTIPNVIATGAWQTISGTITAPVNVVQNILIRLTNRQVGDVFQIDNVALIPGTYTGSYFDGDTPSTGDTYTVWTGTPHASTTEQRAPYCLAFQATTSAVSWQSNQWSVSGNKSVAILNSVSGGYVEGGVALTPGSVYTAMATSYSAVSSTKVMQIRFYGSTTQSASVPLTVAGVGQHKITFTVPADTTSATFRLQGGFTAGGVAVPTFFDNMVLTPGAYSGPYFDGDNPSAGDFTTVWTGIPHASTTEVRAPALAGGIGQGNGITYGARAWQSYARAYNGTASVGYIAPGIATGDTGIQISFGGLTVGNTYTAVAWAYQPSLFTTNGVRIGVYMSGGWGGTSAWSTTIGQWVQLSVTFTANTANGAVVIGSPQVSAGLSAPAPGAQLWVDGMMLVAGAYTGPYFDGSTPHPDSDFTTVWAGSVHGSVTNVNAPNIGAMPNANGGTSRTAVVQSSQWSKSGSKSVRIIPLDVATDTSVNLFGGTATLSGFVPGATYTLLGTLRFTTAYTGPTNGRARSLMFADDVRGWAAAQIVTAPNTPGIYDLRLTFTVSPGATWAIARIYNGSASASNTDVWWDNLMLVEGNYQGPYLDGDTPGAVWEGTAHASTAKGYPLSPNIITNLITYPNLGDPASIASGASARWVLGSQNLTTARVADSTGSTGFVFQTTATASGRRYMYANSTNLVPVQVGQTYSGMIRARQVSGTPGPAYLTLVPRNASGAGLGDIIGASITPSALGQWVWLRSSGVIPAGTAGVQLQGNFTATSGDVWQWDDAMLVSGTYAEYSDGNTPGWKWTGAQNASASYGYPYTMPLTPLVSAVSSTNTSVNAPSDLPALAGRTLYTVYKATSTTTSYDGIGGTGVTTGQGGILIQAPFPGGNQSRARFDFAGGSSNQVISLAANSWTLGSHITVASLNDGMTRASYMQENTSQVTISIPNPGNGFTQFPTKINLYSNTASTPVAIYLFSGEHDAATKAAIIAWLRNHYGI